MKIPVFVSCPTKLNNNQKKSRKIILEHLAQYDMESRALGTSDFPDDYPLKEVYIIAKHCSGGIILGFEQFRADSGIILPGLGPDKERHISDPTPFPTPWNNLEAGILFSLQIPLLIFRERGIRGGVFDEGVTDVFIHEMPNENESKLKGVFLKWQAKVSNHYRSI